MPCYTFACPTCSAEFDTIQSMNAPFPRCPECGGETRRMISGSGTFLLRGDGWAQSGYYTTDTGDQARADKADRKGSIKSFPGQRNKGRSGL